MTRNRLIAGVALIVLLGVVGAIAAYGVDQEQSPETVTNLSIRGKVVVEAYHYDEATGTYVLFYRDESSNLMVNIGFDWVEDQLGDSPSTDPAKWISLSLSTSSPAAGWTQIPTEIAAGGLSRAVGAYTSTGTGAWEIEATFTASATHTDVQLTGLQSASSGDNNLMAANTFTPVTLTSGDALTITWQLSLS
ncbi:MAG: hypothetical protein E3J24_02825 [Dehalococcoidia bacterium]|nr:MAG: hypothetical protein E3J24_02825 [Dehalococcoidia bacterium]